MSGSLVKNIGFKWMLVGIAIINFIYAPFLLMLRDPPAKEEHKSLVVEKSSVRYVNYKNEDDEE